MAANGPNKPLNLKVTKLPSDELALGNRVFLAPQDVQAIKPFVSKLGNYIQVKRFVFTFDEHPGMKPGFLGMNQVHRRFVEVSLNEGVDVIPFQIPNEENAYLGKLQLEVDFLSKTKRTNDDYRAEDISKVLMRELSNQYFTLEQKFVAEVNGNNLEFRVKQTECMNLTALVNLSSNNNETAELQTIKAERGILHPNTVITFEKSTGSTMRLIAGDSQVRTSLLSPDWNFEKMGIGGLNAEFNNIFRRAFASRIFPIAVVQKLGIQHVKGILLHGPPGTGKTLIARQIGKMLNGKEPKIVNGPEVLNKYVGQSEENIRNLFKDAEAEYKQRGDASDLHIIIFDEIDAICKQRGTKNDGTGVGDTVVNQLLSKIDGVDALNNILLIGMTNRKDLIDEALLRPGRLEVHVEIGLPDEVGRLQILKIHTRKMRENNYMGDDVDLEELALQTKNFSGAEIEGLVKSATSFAFNRQVDVSTGVKVKDGDLKVMREDFMRALGEVKPAFGVDTDDFENCIRNGIINYGAKVEKLLHTGRLFVQQVRNSNRTPLMSVLLEGPSGSGKTALAAKLATESEYPYVKLISPEQLVGYSETGKCSKISKIFEDAYKSPLSCIVVDDIERLLDYVRIGPRFSNAVLQMLLVFFKKEPPKGRRLLIIGTTSNRRVLEDLEFMETFNSVLAVPQISTREEFRIALKELQFAGGDDKSLDKAASVFSTPIAMKKLIMITEMAKLESNAVERFQQFMVEH